MGDGMKGGKSQDPTTTRQWSDAKTNIEKKWKILKTLTKKGEEQRTNKMIEQGKDKKTRNAKFKTQASN